jgi:hypothetical protein
MSDASEPSAPGQAVSPLSPVPLTGPTSTEVAVENPEAAAVVAATKRQYPANEISRRARKSLSRQLYVAEVIAANPLEDARDRMRALEFLRDTGRVADPNDKGRGKVVTVKVYARSRDGVERAVEVRAEG